MSFKIFNFKMITNRKEITVNNQKQIDLVDNMIDFKKQLQVAQQPLEVTKEYEGRPDLIAKAIYGSEDDMDLMLYFNGISNPLSVQRGMEITVYDLDSMRANIKDVENSEDNNESKKKFNEKLPQKDKARIKALQEKSRKKGAPAADDFRTPTMTKEGSKPVTATGGRVVLGTNVTDVRCKDKISPVQTLTEKIRQAVKDKIKEDQASKADVSVLGKGRNNVRPRDVSRELNSLSKGIDQQVKSSEFKRRGL